MRARVLSNAIWNVVNGSSSALVAVLVPPFLTRSLGPEAYGAWALALQIGTYVGLFGFGVQMAVGRYVAYAEARRDDPMRDGIVSTAFWFLLAASALGWIAISGVGLMIDRIVPQLSADLIGETRWAVVLVGLGLAINLPASIFAAVFTGNQRSDVPAKIQGVGRLAQAAALILVGPFQNLTLLGAVYTMVAMVTVAALWWAWRTGTRAPTLARHHISRAHGRELFGFCLSLTLWNFAMLLVTGLDLIIVGRFDYAATPFYAVAITLVTLVSGTLSSLASALVPAAAAIQDEDDGALRRLLSRASRLIMGASLIIGLPLIFEGHTILTWWLGPGYADEAAPLLSWLIIATIIRNAMIAYVTIAIGIGYQRKMLVTPLIEGAVTVGASLVLAHVVGAEGVAFGKILGGVCGVSLLLAQYALREPLGGVTRSEYLVHSVFRPMSAIIPVALLAWGLDTVHPREPFGLVCISLATIMAVWFASLHAEDRNFALKLIRSRIGRRLPESA